MKGEGLKGIGGFLTHAYFFSWVSQCYLRSILLRGSIGLTGVRVSFPHILFNPIFDACQVYGAFDFTVGKYV